VTAQGPIAGDLLAPDREGIAAFLSESLATGIHLAWIIPDGPCGGRWFGNDAQTAATWAASNNASGRTVYWTVNTVGAGLNKKPEKADITSARFVHLDIDPPKDGRPFERQAILEQLRPLEPSFVIDSGGGLQAFWRLHGECQDLAAIEGLNLQVRELFRADACHNIDRLMRVPATINWPDKRKKARGRVPAMAGVLLADTGEAIDADGLSERFAAALAAQRGSTNGEEPASLLEELGVAPACQPLHRLLTATDPKRRSEEVLHAAGEMLRRGYGDAVIVRVLLDPALAISGHCLEQADPQRAAERAIARARLQARGHASEAGGEAGKGVQLLDFYAYMPAHSYIFAPTGEHWPAASINARIPPVPLLDCAGNPLLEKDGKATSMKPSAWLDQNRPVEQMTWAPGEPQIVENRLISDGGWIGRLAAASSICTGRRWRSRATLHKQVLGSTTSALSIRMTLSISCVGWHTAFSVRTRRSTMLWFSAVDKALARIPSSSPSRQRSARGTLPRSRRSTCSAGSMGL
jgi:hypothetical protein